MMKQIINYKIHYWLLILSVFTSSFVQAVDILEMASDSKCCQIFAEKVDQFPKSSGISELIQKDLEKPGYLSVNNQLLFGGPIYYYNERLKEYQANGIVACAKKVLPKKNKPDLAVLPISEAEKAKEYCKLSDEMTNAMKSFNKASDIDISIVLYTLDEYKKSLQLYNDLNDRIKKDVGKILDEINELDKKLIIDNVSKESKIFWSQNKAFYKDKMNFMDKIRSNFYELDNKLKTTESRVDSEKDEIESKLKIISKSSTLLFRSFESAGTDLMNYVLWVGDLSLKHKSLKSKLEKVKLGEVKKLLSKRISVNGKTYSSFTQLYDKWENKMAR